MATPPPFLGLQKGGRGRKWNEKEKFDPVACSARDICVRKSTTGGKRDRRMRTRAAMYRPLRLAVLSPLKHTPLAPDEAQMSNLSLFVFSSPPAASSEGHVATEKQLPTFTQTHIERRRGRLKRRSSRGNSVAFPKQQKRQAASMMVFANATRCVLFCAWGFRIF